jgi:hypothetical protein
MCGGIIEIIAAAEILISRLLARLECVLKKLNDALLSLGVSGNERGLRRGEERAYAYMSLKLIKFQGSKKLQERRHQRNRFVLVRRSETKRDTEGSL